MTFTANNMQERSDWSQFAQATAGFLAGGASGSLAKSCIAPLDRVKIIFQVSPHKQFSFRAALTELKAIIHSEGFTSLWRGNGATVAR